MIIPGGPGYGGADAANATATPIRYRLDEKFAGFQTFDGLTLPTSYVIRYDVEGQRMAHQRYTNSFTEIVNNVSLDSRNFEIK